MIVGIAGCGARAAPAEPPAEVAPAHAEPVAEAPEREDGLPTWAGTFDPPLQSAARECGALLAQLHELARCPHLPPRMAERLRRYAAIRAQLDRRAAGPADAAECRGRAAGLLPLARRWGCP